MKATRSPNVTTRILVPIDFSDCSRCTLPYAVSLAKSLRATLVLLYVAETNPPGTELGLNRSADLETDLRRIAKRELARLRKVEMPADVKSQSVIRAGRADTEILDVAKSLKADLILMSMHSKCSPEGQLGSTAGRVTSLASCPVLLVPVQRSSVPFFL